MSITDAKDPASWQIGFEDGIKFAMKVVLPHVLEDEEPELKCTHFWYHKDKGRLCHNCGKWEPN